MTEDAPWATHDAARLRHHAKLLLEAYRKYGRLPFPAGPNVREVHDMLGEIVAGMDDKMKEVA